jgi:hypothetical protein
MTKRAMSKRYWRMEVEWVDSHVSDGGWHPCSWYVKQKKHRRPVMVSAGFVLADDKTGVILANSVDPTYNAACGVIHIPAGAVLSRRRLR